MVLGLASHDGGHGDDWRLWGEEMLGAMDGMPGAGGKNPDVAPEREGRRNSHFRHFVGRLALGSARATRMVSAVRAATTAAVRIHMPALSLPPHPENNPDLC